MMEDKILMKRIIEASQEKLFPTVHSKTETPLRKGLLSSRLWASARREQEKLIELEALKCDEDWWFATTPDETLEALVSFASEPLTDPESENITVTPIITNNIKSDDWSWLEDEEQNTLLDSVVNNTTKDLLSHTPLPNINNNDSIDFQNTLDEDEEDDEEEEDDDEEEEEWFTISPLEHQDTDIIATLPINHTAATAPETIIASNTVVSKVSSTKRGRGDYEEESRPIKKQMLKEDATIDLLTAAALFQQTQTNSPSVVVVSTNSSNPPSPLLRV